VCACVRASLLLHITHAYGTFRNVEQHMAHFALIWHIQCALIWSTTCMTHSFGVDLVFRISHLLSSPTHLLSSPTYVALIHPLAIASIICTLIERNPPPRGGFMFTIPNQEPWVRGPPWKNLVQIRGGKSAYTRFFMREHSK